MPRYLFSEVLGKVKVRSLSESLFAVTLIAGAYYLLHYVPRHVKAGEPVVALANYFLTYSPIQDIHQPAYVVSDSIEVWDTPAEIRQQVATLKCGEQVQALGRFRDWTHVRTMGGQGGWVNTNALMNAETHQAEERLGEQISDMSAQARGHANDVDNIHIAPSRDGAVVAEVNPSQTLGIFGRRMVRRSDINRVSTSLPVPSHNPLEAWYLVQEGSHTGWILGHRVQLDIPKSISAYSQDTNLVAWLVLDTTDDNGRRMPQYLVADRVGTETCDFTDIRVLTWWQKKQTYAIAYKETELQGYFPILVTHEGSVPQFRLRLIDDAGSKYQGFYGLFDTMTRHLGTALTWQEDATPQLPASRLRTQEARRTGSLPG